MARSHIRNSSRSQVPEGVREALIVLVPGTGEGDGLIFRSKVIDLSKFRKGGCLYVNLVKTNIGIKIGEHKTVVKPGGMEFINPLEQEDKGVFPVGFFYEVPDQSTAEWKLMTSSKMAIYKSRREICIFFYNEEIENVDFRGIPFMTPQPGGNPDARSISRHGTHPRPTNHPGAGGGSSPRGNCQRPLDRRDARARSSGCRAWGQPPQHPEGNAILEKEGLMEPRGQGRRRLIRKPERD